MRSNTAKQVSSHRPRISLNHVIDWDRAKVIDRESNRVDQLWISEATHVRKEQDKSMNQDEASYQLHHICDNVFIAVTSSGKQKSFRGRQPRLKKRQQISK